MEYDTLCTFICGPLRFEGTISLDTKLYLKNTEGRPLSETFIPVEQIEFMKIKGGVLEIRVFPSTVASFNAFISAKKPGFLKKVAADIAKRVKMKKRFFLSEWHGEVYIR